MRKPFGESRFSHFAIHLMIVSLFYLGVSVEAQLLGVLKLQNNLNGSFPKPLGTITEGRLLHNKTRTSRDPIYSPFPNCPDECLDAWIGDGWCDTSCANEHCSYDAEDCKEWCAPDCPSAWIGDGHCDLNCFRPECHYDGNDCRGRFQEGEITFPLPKHEDFDYFKCPVECDREQLNNEVCDSECNRKECNFDGGDCFYQCSPECSNQWLGDTQCDIGCNTTSCYFDKGDCKVCSPGCEPGMVGNGVCDSACYNEECYMDMGDCFGLCWFAEKMDYFSLPFYYPHCRNEWKGDGSCDCLCMTPECGYDFGDCRNYNCSRDWKHLKESYASMNLSIDKIPHLHPTLPSPSTTRVLKHYKKTSKRKEIY